jgi:hypothetical protein
VNRTKSKVEPLAKSGAKIVDARRPRRLRRVLDVSAGLISTRSISVCACRHHGRQRLPKIFIDCSTIAVEEYACAPA